MSHLPRPITRALTYLAYFLGLLLLTALWTVYGPSYDAQAAPTPDTSSQASDPCPAGEATGGTCGTEGPVDGPAAPDSTSPSPDASPTPQRRCKGCRLSQEEYDARQADKQAAHDRAEARKQRGAERRAASEHRRQERAARKSSSSKSSSSKPPRSASDGSAAPSSTDTTSDTPQAAQDAPEAYSDSASSDDSTSDSDSSSSAPYTPLEIPEASHRPAPYDASKDPFEVRREAARQAADAVNSSASHSTSPDQVKAPTPTSTSPTGYWAEQMPTWALALIGFLAAAGLVTSKAYRSRSRS